MLQKTKTKYTIKNPQNIHQENTKLKKPILAILASAQMNSKAGNISRYICNRNRYTFVSKAMYDFNHKAFKILFLNLK